jgi:hypothetical protein
VLLIVPRRPTAPWPLCRPVDSQSQQAPFFCRHMRELLQKSFFSVLQAEKALFYPPGLSWLGLDGMAFWQRLGERGMWPFAHMNVIRAQKQVYRLTVCPQPLQLVGASEPRIILERGLSRG